MRGGFSFSFSELPHCNLILKLRLQSVINLIIRMGLNRIYPTPRIALSDVRPLDRHCLTFSPHVTCTHTHLMCVCALHMLTHLIRQPSDTLTCQMDWGREGHKSQSHSLRVLSLCLCLCHCVCHCICLCLCHCVFLCHCLFVGQAVSPHHSDKMSQRSQVSRVNL